MDSKNLVSCIVVEDDPSLGPLIKSQLEGLGFKVNLYTSCSECFKVQQPPQCAVIDWNLKDGEGVSILDSWKTKGWMFPVIFLTARTLTSDKILALQLGASDYMTKPFDINELAARLMALLRLQGENCALLENRDTLTLGLLTIEPSRGTVTWNGNETILPNLEFKLLVFLARSPNLVFTRDEILMRVWGEDTFVTNRTVDNHILQLRKKLHPALIETVWSSGYRLKVLSALPGFLLTGCFLFKYMVSGLHILLFTLVLPMVLFAASLAFQCRSAYADVGPAIESSPSAYSTFSALGLAMEFESARQFAKENFSRLLEDDFSKQVSFRKLLNVVLVNTVRKSERYPDDFLRLDASNCAKETSRDGDSIAMCGKGDLKAKLFLDKNQASERLSLTWTIKNPTHAKLVHPTIQLDTADTGLPGRTWFGKTLHIRYVSVGQSTKLRGYVIRVFWKRIPAELQPEQFLVAYSSNDLKCPMAIVRATTSMDFYQDLLNTLDLMGDTFQCNGSRGFSLSSY